MEDSPEPLALPSLPREARHVEMRRLATEAMADPGFVADLRETMRAFRHVDQEHWPLYDEEQPDASRGQDETDRLKIAR